MFNVGNKYKIKRVINGMPSEVKKGNQLKIVDAEDIADGLHPSLYKVEVKKQYYIVDHHDLAMAISK
jgi:hypothetical protein